MSRVEIRRLLRGSRLLGLTLARRPAQIRHLRAYARSRGRSLLEQRTPWLAFDLIGWLREVVGPDTSVFEFGGGGSTAWFADRGASVVTVEHDADWAAKLRATLGALDTVSVLEAGSADGFSGYTSSIDSYPDSSFDLVLVDGRSRVECVRHAMSKVRPGGHIVLDDSERAKYSQAFTVLQGWTCRRFDGLAPGKPNAAHSTAWQRPS